MRWPRSVLHSTERLYAVSEVGQFFYGILDNKMTTPALRLAACAFVVPLCDAIFVGLLMRRPYAEMVTDVQKTPISLRKVPALVASLSVVVGLWGISLSNENPWNIDDQKNAAVFGLSAFLMYNATNLAIFEAWSVQNAFVDTLYGTSLCALTYAGVAGVISDSSVL